MLAARRVIGRPVRAAGLRGSAIRSVVRCELDAPDSAHHGERIEFQCEVRLEYVDAFWHPEDVRNSKLAGLCAERQLRVPRLHRSEHGTLAYKEKALRWKMQAVEELFSS